ASRASDRLTRGRKAGDEPGRLAADRPSRREKAIGNQRPRLPFRVRTLLAIQLEVLFARTPSGELLATRDPTPRAAPRVFVGRSVDGNVWALRADLAPGTKAELSRLLAAEPPVAPERDAGLRCRERILDLLGAAREVRGPAYVLGDALPHGDQAREITRSDLDRCRHAFPWLAEELEAVAPVAVAFCGDEPAAICHAPRGVTAAAAEAGVETLPRFRRRGLATAAVACWARAVQRSGRLALYSTSWQNRASLALARRVSAHPYGEDWQVT